MKLGNRQFDVRPDTWDESIVRSVYLEDEYALRVMAKERVTRILDLGAHIGAFSLLAREVWPEAKIIAVEADAENFQFLERNTAGAGIKCIHAAVTDSDQKEVGFRPRTVRVVQNTGCGGLDDNGPVKVPAIKIGVLVQEWTDIIKIDTEGAEQMVISDLTLLGLWSLVGRCFGEWHGFAKRDWIMDCMEGVKTHSCVVFNPPAGDCGHFFIENWKPRA